MKKVCIIVPHGDDEVLGFAGAIQTHIKNNNEVHVIFCTGSKDLRSEKQVNDIKKAKDILKYHKVHHIQSTKIELTHEPILFFNKLECCLKQIDPDIVYTTFWNDIHQDHKTVYEWVCRAIRIWGPLNIKQFFIGEIPSSTDQYPKINGYTFNPNYYLKLTEDEVKLKIKALLCYEGEIQESPHPRSEYGISLLSKQRGQECGTSYAEAFMCLKYIE
jgi:LmbE family N-acetylglucosaminyl deacetylase